MIIHSYILMKKPEGIAESYKEYDSDVTIEFKSVAEQLVDNDMATAVFVKEKAFGYYFKDKALYEAFRNGIQIGMFIELRFKDLQNSVW